MKTIRFAVLFSAVTFFLCADQVQDFWKGDEYAKHSASQKASAGDFMQGFKFNGDEAILDVGCGDGKITAKMARAVPQGSVVGVDISSSMIQFAKKKFTNFKNLSFQVQDASNLNFEKKFDFIISFSVMQWVLEQSKALECFEKALKPGGKVWIQFPTGLPSAMQEALEKTISNDRWKSNFDHFSPPWKFYELEEYRTLLMEAHLNPIRLEILTKHERFPSRKVFQEFVKQWFPYLRPFSDEAKKDAFLTEVLDHYLQILPVDEQGRVSFIVDRLEAEAIK